MRQNTFKVIIEVLLLYQRQSDFFCLGKNSDTFFGYSNGNSKN